MKTKLRPERSRFTESNLAFGNEMQQPPLSAHAFLNSEYVVCASTCRTTASAKAVVACKMNEYNREREHKAMEKKRN